MTSARVRAAAAAAVVWGALVASRGTAQSGHDLPNPFEAPVRNWATLPEGRAWGSTAGVEIGPHGELWAVDRCGANSCDGSSLPAVHELDLATGRPIKSIGAGLFVFPHGLHVDRDGNVWVTDAQTSKDHTKGQQVIKLSPDGRVLLRLGTAGVAGGGPTHFNEPSDVITTATGEIFVVDGHSGESLDTAADFVTRVVKFSANGKFIKEWGRSGSGPGQFHNPHALALDARGRLFVGDRGNSRIQVFNLDGGFIAEWRQFGRPSGVYIDAQDRLYVADANSSATNNPGFARGIRIGSAKDGVVTGFVPGHSTDAPEGTVGEGMATDAAGNLYGAENVLRGVTKYAKR